jgi:hypothetical protein
MRSIATIVILGLLAGGCAFNRQVVLTDSVGPPPAVEQLPSSNGDLVVFSAFETGDAISSAYEYVQPHTPYDIYATDGKLFKAVENHVGLDDQSPTLVTIPAGNYDVHAESDFGPVIVPVLIKPFKTTEVNLESVTARKSRNTNDASVVWIPTGPSRAYYAVGARAESSTNAETK